jgi:hypothetical protein
LVCTATPEVAAVVVLVEAALWVGVLAGAEAALELLEVPLLPQPASSTKAAVPAVPRARGRFTVAS